MAPPESRFSLTAPAAAAAVLVPVGDEVALAVVNRGGIEVTLAGIVYPVHMPVTFDMAQHESVELGELEAQYPQRPCTFVEKPQFLGSFAAAVMHEPVRESAGSAQLVKSARICAMKLLLVVPQSCEFTVISSSLSANCAY